MVKKFPHLFLVLLIEGGALMAVELMGAKLVAPFYGDSLYVWTAVLTITVLGLTLGYYAGGRLSRKRAVRNNAVHHSRNFGGAGPGIATDRFNRYRSYKGNGSDRRHLHYVLLLLLPPMLCFGIVGPMVVA